MKNAGLFGSEKFLNSPVFEDMEKRNE